MSLSSRGPGHRPLMAATRVRIPLGIPVMVTLIVLGLSLVVESQLVCSGIPSHALTEF